MVKQRQIPQAVRSLADEVGEFIAYWGFKHVHGRIWTHLALSTEPLDASELIRRLKISKALASMSLKDLMKYDVILHAGKSDKGTQLYRVNPNIMEVIFNVLRHRECKMIEKITKAIEAVKDIEESQKQSCCLDEKALEVIESATAVTGAALHHFLSRYHLDLAPLKETRVGGD